MRYFELNSNKKMAYQKKKKTHKEQKSSKASAGLDHLVKKHWVL